MKDIYKQVVQYNRIDANCYRIVAAGISVMTINLIGLFMNNFAFNGLGTMGLFALLNYKPEDQDRIMKRVTFVGLFIIVGHALGMLSTISPWLAPIVTFIVAFTARLLFRIFKFERLGDIFIIIVTAFGTTRPIPLAKMPEMSFFLAVGVMIAILASYLLVKIEGLTPQAYWASFNIGERVRQDPRVIVDSFYYAATLFFASYLTMALNLGAYSWVVASCSAILQGNTLIQIISRNFQRIIGTTAGLLTSALLLSFGMPPIGKIILLTLCFMISEYYTARNYSIGVFFITIMLMTQMIMVNPRVLPTLLWYRFLGILIGSLLGVLSASIQFRLYHFYSQSVINKRTYDQEIPK